MAGLGCSEPEAHHSLSMEVEELEELDLLRQRVHLGERAEQLEEAGAGRLYVEPCVQVSFPPF